MVHFERKKAKSGYVTQDLTRVYRRGWLPPPEGLFSGPAKTQGQNVKFVGIKYVQNLKFTKYITVKDMPKDNLKRAYF